MRLIIRPVVAGISNWAAYYIANNEEIWTKYKHVLRFLTEEKRSGDADIANVLYLKGRIRSEEARAACRFVGLKPENVHFLDMPFYETGKVQKGKLTDKDIVKIITLLERYNHTRFMWLATLPTRTERIKYV